IALTNAFSMEDVLTRLAGPDYTGGISTSTNGGLGLSEIGLRNLGPNRTLVLIDGQRLVPIFSGATSVPDLNSVPVSMVDRVEVLRDGASSIYGADAIGGVINIITKKNFDGLQLDSSGGLDQHGGGASYSVGGTLGFNTDRGNLTVSVVHEVLDPVDQPQRDWSQDPHFGDPIFPGGSTYRSQLNILQDANSDTVWNNGIETSLTNPALGSLPCLTFFPDLGRVMLNAGCPAIHPSATVTSGLERTQFSFSGHYDIADHVRLIASGFFTDRQSEQRLRPEPLLGVQIATTDPSNGLPVFNGFQVPVSWPGFTDPNHTAAIAPCADPAGCIDANYTPDEFGPRDYRQSSRTYRIRVGLEGDFLDNFKWEAGFIAQRNDATYRDYNSGDYQHLAQATGQAPCLDVPGGCTFSPAFGYAIPTTPFNFFNGVGTLTPTQVQYLTFTMTDTNYSYQNYGYANLNGKLFDLPAGPLQFAAGFERRYEYLADNPDPLVQAGYAANTGEPTAGGYNVTSVYGELRIPLIKDAPFMESLTLNPSARYDHYSDFGDAETWKVAGEWKISRDVRVRASWASGFRAPSTAELFGGNVVTYVPVSGDPCDSRAAGLNGNANAGAGSLAAGSACYTQLSAQGLTPAQIATYQSPENNVTNDQRALVIGGNPNLQPEKSRQWNAGVVLTPRFLPGFSADADYYQVHIHNSIVTGGIPVNFGPDLVVDGCYVAQNTQDCSLITRNSGGVFQVSSQNTNFGITWVKGLDMEVAYDTAAAGWTLPFPGSFVLDLQAERQFDNKAQQPDGSVANSGGTYNYFSESVSPKWRGRANLDYHLGTWTFHYDAQWIGHAYDFYFPDPANAVHGDYIPNYFYHNISMAFELPSAGPVQRTNMVLGINNLLDKDPPFLGTDGNCKCNSLGGPYDFYGREFFARVSAKF
ncbi:MAG TPA: TonB-dependent receptor, partial [Caulobacteraceae bacterium]